MPARRKLSSTLGLCFSPLRLVSLRCPFLSLLSFRSTATTARAAVRRWWRRQRGARRASCCTSAQPSSPPSEGGGGGEDGDSGHNTVQKRRTPLPAAAARCVLRRVLLAGRSCGGAAADKRARTGVRGVDLPSCALGWRTPAADVPGQNTNLTCCKTKVGHSWRDVVRGPLEPQLAGPVAGGHACEHANARKRRSVPCYHTHESVPEQCGLELSSAVGSGDSVHHSCECAGLRCTCKRKQASEPNADALGRPGPNILQA